MRSPNHYFNNRVGKCLHVLYFDNLSGLLLVDLHTFCLFDSVVYLLIVKLVFHELEDCKWLEVCKQKVVLVVSLFETYAISPSHLLFFHLVNVLEVRFVKCAPLNQNFAQVELSVNAVVLVTVR